MSETDPSTPIDRLWNRLEARYGTDELGGFTCDCTGPDDTVEVLHATALTKGDLEAYREGRTSIAELVATLEVDLDHDAVDDLDALVSALDDREGESAGRGGRP